MNSKESVKANRFGALPSSEEMVKKAGIGIWAMELDEGKAPRMYCDDVLRNLIGITEAASPEDVYNTWYDNIAFDYYSILDGAIEQMSAGRRVEVQLSWNAPNGSAVTTRYDGVRNDEYADGIRLEGVYRVVMEELHFGRGLISRVKEDAKVIQSFTEKYDIVFRVNMEDDSYELLKRKKNLKDYHTHTNSFSEVLTNYISKRVYEPDRDMMLREASFENIRQRLKEKLQISIEYRLVTGDTAYWHEMVVRLIEGDIIAVGFIQSHRRILSKGLSRKTSEKYFAMYILDLDRDEYTVIKGTPSIDAGQTGYIGKTPELRSAFLKALKGMPNDFFQSIGDTGYLKKAFIKEDRYTYPYQIELDRERIIVSGHVIKRGIFGEPVMLSVGLTVMDAFEREAQIRLEKAIEKAEAASGAKSAFLFNMSHDIRTPINGIMGFTDMALRRIDNTDKVRECLCKVKESSTLLLSLINGVLDMSRIESGKAEPEENPGDVYLAFKTIEKPMTEQARRKDIDLTFGFKNIQDRYVYCDFSMCLRVIVNLISNAIKYTGAGGYVKVVCEQKGRDYNGRAIIVFTVEDNGIGMSEEFMLHAFDAYSRERNTTTSGIQGTGLGLTVCKTFVEAMGGTIRCESKLGEGSKFIVTLPLKLQDSKAFIDPETREVVDAESPETVRNDYDFNGMKVLLVEDNELNREIALDVMEEEGFEMDEAVNGLEALRALEEKGPDYYDFILMDIQMPVMDGYEATREIRKKYGKEPVIIAVSANAFDEDRQKSIEAGMNEHVAKPVDVGKLKAILGEFVRLSKI